MKPSQKILSVMHIDALILSKSYQSGLSQTKSLSAKVTMSAWSFRLKPRQGTPRAVLTIKQPECSTAWRLNTKIRPSQRRLAMRLLPTLGNMMLQSIFVIYVPSIQRLRYYWLRQETPTTMPNPEVLKLQSRDVTSCHDPDQSPHLTSLAAKVLKRWRRLPSFLSVADHRAC